MSIFQWITFIMGLVTQILPLIQAIEAAVGAGNGEIKKQIAIDSVTAAAKASGASEAQVAQTIRIVSPLIDSNVAALNKTGTFQVAK
jgi:hypothetical protein